MKIGDLWIKLGLKKEDFDKGINGAGKGLGGLLAKTTAMSTAFTKLWDAAIEAVKQFVTSAINMTQKWGDAWNVEMAGIEAAYGTFVRQISSGDGWSQLFSNMAEASRRAKQIAAALDEVFERKISFSYKEASTNRDIANLRLIMNDRSKSDEERKKAAKDIIELEEKLGEEKKDIWQQEAVARRAAFRDATGLSDKQTDFLVKQYNENRNIINDGRRYLKEQAKLQKEVDLAQQAANAGRGRQGSDFLNVNLERAKSKLAEFESATSQTVKDVAQLTKNYDKSSDELVETMAQAEVAVINIDTEVAGAQMRANSMLGSLNKVKVGGNNKIAEHLERDVARAQQRIEDSIEDMMEDVEDELGEKIEPIKFEPLEIVPPDMTEWNNWYETYESDLQRMQDLLADLADAAIGGFTDAVQELADQFAGLSDINPGRVISALLTPLADMAVKEGQILVASGLGIEAVKKGLETLNGVAAITAGTALIAIGAAAKAGLSALANGGASSTSTSTYSGATTGGETVQNLTSELVVRVEGRLSGNDIVLSGQRTVNNWQR